MKIISYKRIYQSMEYFSGLGKVQSRALFGGYSLAVDNTVFAMVAEGELYLRACEKNAAYQSQYSPPLLPVRKRGHEQQLNYFRVDERLWSNKSALVQLGQCSLEDAQNEKRRRRCRRLRDLPNLSFHLELLLLEAGIKDVRTLRQMGAKTAWMRLRQIRKQLNVSVLYSLEGAIIGVHSAALPAQTRQELEIWVQNYTQRR